MTGLLCLVMVDKLGLDDRCFDQGLAKSQFPPFHRPTAVNHLSAKSFILYRRFHSVTPGACHVHNSYEIHMLTLQITHARDSF